MNIERMAKNECHDCMHMRAIRNNALKKCINPPDEGVPAKQRGIDNGWFNFPECFDPIWKLNFCWNYKEGKQLFKIAKEAFDISLVNGDITTDQYEQLMQLTNKHL